MTLAQKYLDRLNDLYGMGNPGRSDPKYAQPLDVFVWNQTKGEYEFQPHLAPSDVAASLRYAFRVGIGQNRPEVFERAVAFAAKVTNYFKYDDYNYYVTKMGSARLGDMIADLENSAPTVLAQLLVDGQLPLGERLVIYRYSPDELKVRVYDDVYPILAAEFEVHPLGQLMPIDTALPPPPGLDEYRRLQREQEEDREGGQEGVERK